MTKDEVLKELEVFGDAQTKKTLTRHGAREPFFGVKVQDLKKILKKTKKNHELSLELYATGNSDAMYLAGLMADETQITKQQLEDWIGKAYWSYLNEYTVPFVASETPFGYELGTKWIESDDELIASAGWNTLAGYSSVNEDEKLDILAYDKLLDLVETKIHSAKNREKYTMNGFVIAIGGNITSLNGKAKEVAERIGKVSVDMNGTACKVPMAIDYIKKVEARGKVGVKRKTARC